MPTLNDLVGKVCTVTTVEVNFRYKPEQMMDYFMGELVSVDDEFLWLRHPQTKCLSAIARKYLVNIAEEQVLYEDNPDHAKIIEEYRQEKPVTAAKTVFPPTPTQPPSPTQFVNPKQLAELAKKAKESFGKKENK
jgi:hypothetical protein